MKNLFILLSVIIFNFPFIRLADAGTYVGADATPIRNVVLVYNADKKVLHIEAEHPSDRPQLNFVRKVDVIKNSQETAVFYFSSQGKADKFITDLDYEAQPGDHLDVNLYGSLGGSAQGSIDITAPESMRERNEQTPVSNRK